MWNESGTRSAFGQYPATDESIHLAPSPVTILMEARCSGVNSSKNRSRTCLPYPSCAQITRLRSWSTTTVMYVWPFLWLVSSTPIAVSPSNMHGMPDSSRPATRPAMSPAVLHATCRKPLTVFLLATVISHVHSISKSRVNRMPGSAHGTRDTTTPCTRHSTRGAGPTSSNPIAAEVLVQPTPFAAPVVVFRAFAPAARATQRGLPAPDARHQDRSVAQRGIVDGHVLDDHDLDVEQTFEYVLHKAFSVVLFLGRKTNLQETPLTPS